MLHDVRVAPHFFQAIELAGLSQHHMNHNVHVIDKNPLQAGASFLVKRHFVAGCFNMIGNLVGNGFELSVVIHLANHKKVSYCLGDFSQVKTYNMLAFFLVDRVNNGLEKFTIAGEFVNGTLFPVL